MACSRIEAISDGPPRGIRQSMNPSSCMNSTADSRLVSSTSPTASAGSPALARPSRSSAAMTVLDSMADDEPRNSTALPDFRQSPAASLVTLGRFS